jgi:putative PIG3 family NAD(P)H quinone oxidoreductase
VRAVLPASPTSSTPRLGELPDPVPGTGEDRIAVRAAGLNHADLLQLRGFHPPPAGESAIPGLECSGVVDAIGQGVEGLRVGDRVMALLGGGGQAEKVAAPAGQVMPLPAGMSFVEGAALPEACLTAWTNLVAEGGVRTGEVVLVTGATGGMGTMAVQLARALGARVLAASRSAERLERLRGMGAEATIRLGESLPEEVSRSTGGRGADLVLDFVGGPHLSRCLAALRPQGRLILMGLLAGRKAEVNLDLILGRRLRIAGSMLRPRPRAEKAALVRAFAEFALPLLERREIRPVVDQVFPLTQIESAYAALAEGGVAGKIVVTMAEPKSGDPA